MAASLVSKAVMTIALADYRVSSDGGLWRVDALPGVAAVSISAASKELAYGALVHHICEHRREDVKAMISMFP